MRHRQDDISLRQDSLHVCDACDRDFAMVGGGAVLDDDTDGVRVGCGLANIAGYVVSENARQADLQVQPVPNSFDVVPAGRYRAAIVIVDRRGRKSTRKTDTFRIARPGGVLNYGFASLWSFIGRPSYEVQSSPGEVVAGDPSCLRGALQEIGETRDQGPDIDIPRLQVLPARERSASRY